MDLAPREVVTGHLVRINIRAPVPPGWTVWSWGRIPGWSGRASEDGEEEIEVEVRGPGSCRNYRGQ